MRPVDVASASRGAMAAYLIWPGTDDAAVGATEVSEPPETRCLSGPSSG